MKRLTFLAGISTFAVCASAQTLPELEQLLQQANNDQGYRPLFTENLSNAIVTDQMWQFKNGEIYPAPKLAPEAAKWKQKSGGIDTRQLWTQESYGDFILDLEFKCDKKTNSGIFIRCADPADWLNTSMEIQVLQYKPKTLRTGIGSIYDCKAPDKKPPLKEAGEWNRYTIICSNNWIHIILNGELVNSMNLDLWTTAGKNPDGTPNKFKTAYKDMPREGLIGLQYHGQPVRFRNVRIKEL